MDKKKLLIIGGVLLVAGAGIYFWKKNKDAKSVSEDSKETSTSVDSKETSKTGLSTGASTGASTGTSTETSVESKAPAKTLTTRKEKRKACGRRPALKKKRAEWQKCVDAGGEASFDGDFDGFQNDYMDFCGSYSSFESQFDIDL